MTDRTSEIYRDEFRALGIERVRSELRARRWTPDKLAAARVWVDRQDVGRWMDSHRDAPAKTPKKSLRKWLLIVLATFGLLFVVTRILSSLGHL